MNLSPAPHSDFLVHWTGRDIDGPDDKETHWTKVGNKLSDDEIEAYANRLENILRYGFWMTEEPAQSISAKGHAPVEIPAVKRTCFTELRLSLSRSHARNYGRLGIAVKRPFVVMRGGRPMVYYAYCDDNTADPFLTACLSDFKSREMLGYLKAMNSSIAEGESPRLKYDFYAESEWRIIYREELEAENRARKPPGDFSKFANSPSHVLPLCGWLAMIIYPSFQVKAHCLKHTPIRELIEEIKQRNLDHGNMVEPGNMPAEINLDDCMHF